MDDTEIPEKKLSRVAAAFQVIVCCGQLPTQTAIAGLLLVVGIVPEVNGATTLTFFAALTLLDTLLVIWLMRVFLADSGDSARAVFFGQAPIRHEFGLGIIFTPLVLIGALAVVAALRVAIPSLHNVPVSPFDTFLTTPPRALLFTFVVIVAGGVREELQRGFLLHRFDQKLGGMPVGLAIYSVVFGAAHFTQGYDVAIATGLLGLFWGWLYMKRRSVVAAMVSHAGFNATQVLQQLALKLIN